MVIDDSDVGAPTGESVTVVCRPKVDNDLDTSIPYEFKLLSHMALASERFPSHTPSKDGM